MGMKLRDIIKEIKLLKRLSVQSIGPEGQHMHVKIGDKEVLFYPSSNDDGNGGWNYADVYDATDYYTHDIDEEGVELLKAMGIEVEVDETPHSYVVDIKRRYFDFGGMLEENDLNEIAIVRNKLDFTYYDSNNPATSTIGYIDINGKTIAFYIYPDEGCYTYNANDEIRQYLDGLGIKYQLSDEEDDEFINIPLVYINITNPKRLDEIKLIPNRINVIKDNNEGFKGWYDLDLSRFPSLANQMVSGMFMRNMNTKNRFFNIIISNNRLSEEVSNCLKSLKIPHEITDDDNIHVPIEYINRIDSKQLDEIKIISSKINLVLDTNYEGGPYYRVTEIPPYKNHIGETVYVTGWFEENDFIVPYDSSPVSNKYKALLRQKDIPCDLRFEGMVINKIYTKITDGK